MASGAALLKDSGPFWNLSGLTCGNEQEQEQRDTRHNQPLPDNTLEASFRSPFDPSGPGQELMGLVDSCSRVPNLYRPVFSRTTH